MNNPNNILSVADYVDGILKGNIVLLSKAITLVESTKEEHQLKAQAILDGVMPHTGNSFRLGITGVPGVGKSTFIESFGKQVVSQHNKLAVLAVDPSSQISKGSILGDKTRMEDLSKNPAVFIRPSPSTGNLGGVARKTHETILLCEAAGFNYIIVETVGVGQSEIAVHQMTDFFLLLMLTGAGDELQGIKRGIMEMADAIAITKSDGSNSDKAKLTQAELKSVMHLFPPTDSGWIPLVQTCSSYTNEGIPELYATIENYKTHTTLSGFFTEKRQRQNLLWFYQTLDEQIKNKFYNNPSVKEHLQKIEVVLKNGTLNPYHAATDLAKQV